MLRVAPRVIRDEAIRRRVREKVKSAVRDLDRDLLTLEATGDCAGGKKMLDSLGVLRPEMTAALGRLKDIPTDIEPVFVTADKVSPR